ncbi:MAG: hypothetical protein JSS77_15915 [Acidobacteria bacterium]|nr:hypothetical protein [Acidobacteriota bacterium]
MNKPQEFVFHVPNGPGGKDRIFVLGPGGGMRNNHREESIQYHPTEGQWALYQRKERKFIRGSKAVRKHVLDRWTTEDDLDRWTTEDDLRGLISFVVPDPTPVSAADEHIALLATLDAHAEGMEPDKSTTIASEAHALVTGPKAEAYGTWLSNMTRAADILNTVYGIDLAPTDIVRVLLAVKLSRDFHKPQRDNPVDIAGYYSGLAELDARYKK